MATTTAKRDRRIKIPPPGRKLDFKAAQARTVKRYARTFQGLAK